MHQGVVYPPGKLFHQLFESVKSEDEPSDEIALLETL